jgi:hypothetical protein
MLIIPRHFLSPSLLPFSPYISLVIRVFAIFYNELLGTLYHFSLQAVYTVVRNTPTSPMVTIVHEMANTLLVVLIYKSILISLSIL